MASADVSSSSPVSVAFPSSHGGQAAASEHPYAIKTTSTAILTRSNSIGASQHTQHFYSPSIHSPAPQLGRSQSRGHRHARSLSNASPPKPLPLPPASPTAQNGSDGLKRSQTMPFASEWKISDLPDNPKAWTPRQLSAYLATALRFRGGGAIPAPVANDIAAFVVKERIGGREFLRLNDERLAQFGINHLWRDSLLAASRTLRKKVLKGRIWGFGATAQDEDEELHKDTPSKRRLASVIHEKSEDEIEAPATPASKAGRVRGLVRSFERSDSSGGEDNDGLCSADEQIKRDLKVAGLYIDATAADEDDGLSSDDFSSASEGERTRDTANSKTMDEPSIEELLAQEVGLESPLVAKEPNSASGTLQEAPSWGAMVWEQNTDEIGGTARRLPASVDPLSPQPTAVGHVNGLFAPPNEDEVVQLKKRVETLERKLQEMEQYDQAREAELSALRVKQRQWQEERRLFEATLQAEKDTPPSYKSKRAPSLTEDSTAIDAPRDEVQRPRLPIAFIANIISRRTTRPSTAITRKRKDGSEYADPLPGELPSYVLLVSLGVCAVVLRVLFRKIGGGRRT